MPRKFRTMICQHHLLVIYFACLLFYRGSQGKMENLVPQGQQDPEVMQVKMVLLEYKALLDLLGLMVREGLLDLQALGDSR
jgi:hypothetical protein